MLVGKDKFTSVYYSGTFFVQKNDDNDYAGFVFNYQSNKRYKILFINLLLIIYNLVLFKGLLLSCGRKRTKLIGRCLHLKL